MIIAINEQIQAIDDALNWIKAYKTQDEYEQRFLQLVQERCKLRKMAAAVSEHPAIAAYGESQKGKSYVMSNILQKEHHPYMVEANGKFYNFIEDINPPTVNKEATGVVTRFSSFTLHPEKYNAKYPVMVKILSVTDMVAILTDGYFNDVHDFEMWTDDEVKEKSEKLYSKYKNMPDVQDTIVEDNIFDLKSYVATYIGTRAQGLYRLSFFEKLSLIIRKIPIDSWDEIFAILWHNSEGITLLFKRLLAAMSRLGFVREVYLPIEAVLNDCNTIMGVECLNGLRDDVFASLRNECRYTTIYVPNGRGQEKLITQFPKCELSAICAETVYKIMEDDTKSQVKYDFDNIPQDTKAKISQAPFTKDILKSSDLLDFPGARAREAFPLAKIEESKAKMLLRGKVAFLFNKYSEDLFINILLFCHDTANTSVSLMYEFIQKWINKYVGDTPQKRSQRMAITQIPPLFLVATKFNMSMVHYPGSSNKNSRPLLLQRWSDRFSSIMADECLKLNLVDWYKDWTALGVPFDNCYLLRDYKYSSDSGDGSKLYNGFYDLDGRETGKESKMIIPEAFYHELRETFISSDAVKMFFSDPEKAWDVAASINNDGSQYLIERLSIVAKNLAAARDAQFSDSLDTVKYRVKNLIEGYYHIENGDDLKLNIQKANSVIHELDFTCNDDNYFFGHLIQSLQLSEMEVYKEVHRLIQSPELNNSVNSFHNYEIILKRCGKKLAECVDDDGKWGCLMDTYALRTKDEAADYLISKGVDYVLLFNGEYKKKLNSYIIADTVFNLWFEKVKSPQLFNGLSDGESFDSVVMNLFIDNMLKTAKFFHLNDIIAEQIAEYVDVVNIHTVNEYLISDMQANVINGFVTDLGYNYRTNEDVSKCMNIAERENLPIFSYIGSDRKSDYNENELTSFFNELSSRPNALTPAFEMNYYEWVEYMYISFIAENAKEDFDRSANEKLSVILDKLN